MTEETARSLISKVASIIHDAFFSEATKSVDNKKHVC